MPIRRRGGEGSGRANLEIDVILPGSLFFCAGETLLPHLYDPPLKRLAEGDLMLSVRDNVSIDVRDELILVPVTCLFHKLGYSEKCKDQVT